MLESAKRLADIDGMPRLTMDSARSFFTEAEAEMVDPPVWAGELYLEYHRGTYTSQAATKLGNRRAEFALRDCELWTSLAGVPDQPGEAIDDLWRLLLVHQFHDIIPGSGIHWVYQDTARDHRRILEEAGRMTAGALDDLVEAIDTSEVPDPFVAFNSLSHARDDYSPSTPPPPPVGWSILPGTSARCSTDRTVGSSSRPRSRRAGTRSTASCPRTPPPAVPG